MHQHLKRDTYLNDCQPHKYGDQLAGQFLKNRLQIIRHNNQNPKVFDQLILLQQYHKKKINLKGLSHRREVRSMYFVLLIEMYRAMERF